MIKSTKSKPSLLRFIYLASGVLTLLLFLAVATAVALSVNIVWSNKHLIEHTLPKSEGIVKAMAEAQTASDLSNQLLVGSSVREVIQTLSVLEKLANALQTAYDETKKLDLVKIDQKLPVKFENAIAKTQFIQSLLEENIMIIRGRMSAENVLKEKLENTSIHLDELLTETEYQLLNIDQKKTRSDLFNEQVLSLKDLQGNVEKLQYEQSNMALVQTERQLRLGFQNFIHLLRDSVETISYLRSNMEGHSAFNTLTAVYTASFNDNSYSNFRLKEIENLNKVFSDKNLLKIELNAIQEILEQVSLGVRIGYASSLEKTKVSGEVALLTFIVILIVSIMLIFYTYFNLIPRRIVHPLRDATTAIKLVAEGETSFPSFDKETKELEQIAIALSGFVSNVKALNEHEKKLDQQKVQLDKLDTELKTFTRVSSHDLKSPLRGIRILCQMILDSLKDQEWEIAEEQIQQIDQRVSRLYNFLDALLAFIHAGDDISELPRQPISDIAHHQLELLDNPAKIETHTNIKCSNISVIEAPFAMVLRNLVDNAIKHHDTTEGNIWVSILPGNNGVIEVLVKDDGPGIPIHYQKRIFEPFETLKPKDMIEGSGMGLAIIVKLVTHIGGQVELRSPISNDRGAEFKVIWPP